LSGESQFTNRTGKNMANEDNDLSDTRSGGDIERPVIEYERLLDRLGSLAQTFGTARDLRSIYQALYQFAIASTPSNSLAISLVEQGTRMVVYACCDGAEIDLSEVPSIKIRGTGPHTVALVTNQITILNDFQGQMQGHKFVCMGFDVDPRLPRSSLIAPMSVMGRVIGSFEIQSPELGAFNQSHVTAMRMAAALAAVAIENVRMLEREREREQRLRQSQKMEAVGRLAGGIAHDFNNLLTAIIGYSQFIQMRLAEEDPLIREVEEIQKASHRAAALTRQLLAFSRKQVLQPKVIDLNTVVSDMEKMLGRLIGEDIELISFPDPELGRVKADPSQVEQVLLNLVVNARDAMPRGGKLIIQTANVVLDESYARTRLGSIAPGRFVMLAVTDTGSGMDRETMSHIFEPFFTTKEQGKGTGLGLSTVYGIVTQSGGDVSVESERTRGTTFKVYLPRVEEAGDQAHAGAAGAGKARPAETVLLVEDEEIVYRLLHEVLEMNGYDVLGANDAREAIAICERHAGRIHLMLTDVVMPRLSGRELAERVAPLRPDMKVLYMSGHTDDAIVHYGVIEAGMAFIQKPFSPNALALKVREVLDAPAAASDKPDSIIESVAPAQSLSEEPDATSPGEDPSNLVH
jgi:signal transduction histidine kinase/CheY-like chemotaxis protein